MIREQGPSGKERDEGFLPQSFAYLNRDLSDISTACPDEPKVVKSQARSLGLRASVVRRPSACKKFL